MLTTGFGLAACFGASTVMEGSGVAEPVAICEAAGPHSKTVDKRAKAEGATNPDDNLMACPFEDGHSVPMRTRDQTLGEIFERGHWWLKVFLLMTAMDMVA